MSWTHSATEVFDIDLYCVDNGNEIDMHGRFNLLMHSQMTHYCLFFVRVNQPAADLNYSTADDVSTVVAQSLCVPIKLHCLTV